MKWRLLLARARYAARNLDPAVVGWAFVTAIVIWSAWMSHR